MKLAYYDWNKLNPTEKTNLLQRPDMTHSFEETKAMVQRIINNIKANGDKQLFAYTEQFDKVTLNNVFVTPEEISQAYQLIDKEKLNAIKHAIARISHNHQGQVPETVTVTDNGISCEKRAVAIDSVGLYVPGGSAPLISTVIMLALPAKIAGCQQRILASPAQKDGRLNPYLLVTADLCSIDKIFKVGGAQAIAAMAYGTSSIPKVDKIFGPGNSYVTLAKQCVAADPKGAAIDMPAGPSEVLVIADEFANVDCVAADLLAQAEHGIDSQVILICMSSDFAKEVNAAISKQVKSLSRNSIIEKSLTKSVCFIVDTIDTAIAISNDYAPEHLILNVKNEQSYLANIKNAGSVFVGPFAAETFGDYISGSNHVLPTYGYAKSYSGLNINDFMKFINFQFIDKQGFNVLATDAITLAKLEGLDAHANAVSKRQEKLEVNHD